MRINHCPSLSIQMFAQLLWEKLFTQGHVVKNDL